MTAELTRAAVRVEIERFLQGTRTRKALAAWAFDQFGDEADGMLSYEVGMEDVIAEVLDELMWADSAPFVLEAATARELQQRLDAGIASRPRRSPADDEDEGDEDDDESANIEAGDR